MTPDRGFVPRAGRRARAFRVGWDTSLPGWTRTRWWVTATAPAGVSLAQRAALVKQVRRVTKRVGTVRVARHPGPVTTGRPVGTRMGKGKGKPTGRRGWVPRGAVVFDLTGPAAAGGVAVLTKRSAGRVRRVARFY